VRQKPFDLLARYISNEKLLLLPDMAVALTHELDSSHSKSSVQAGRFLDQLA
jgi:hypothetical protein